VVRLTDFGAFIELEPGVDGLLHISQMSARPINRPEEIVNAGDELMLMVIRVDTNERRIGLSLKDLAADLERADLREYQSRQRKRRHVDEEEYGEGEEE
jgi:ribosomal protein S1